MRATTVLVALGYLPSVTHRVFVHWNASVMKMRTMCHWTWKILLMQRYSCKYSPERCEACVCGWARKRKGTVFRAGAPDITCFLVVFLLLIFSFFSFVVSIASCSTQQSFKLRHKTSTRYALQSRSFPPSLLRSFIFLFISSFLYLTSLVSESLSPSCCHAAPVRTFIYLHLSLPLRAYSFPIHSPSPTPRGRLYDTRF